MGIHDRYYGKSSEPQPEEKAKPAKPDHAAPDDKAQHMQDALNKDLANVLTNERLKKDGDEK
jgi:hypothetical protein